MEKVTLPSGNTPIWQLTVDQLKAILNNPRSVDSESEEDNAEHNSKRFVRGVKGIKELFNCSYPTAHNLKKTILKPAVHQQGRLIVVDRDLAIKLFEEHKQLKSVRENIEL